MTLKSSTLHLTLLAGALAASTLMSGCAVLVGGAASSIGASKQRSLVFAAQCFLDTQRSTPPCRFDVIAIEDGRIEWLRAAFDAT